ncbi:MAG: phosphoglycerate kinase [Chloroflexi bacterium]|nr:phosphoglycerate kinase [Chloroflexota bacterium]
MKKKTIADVDVHRKRVLVRVDFNVPFEEGTARISDDTRIRAVLPTIRHLIANQARTILCSHLGRPQGQVVEKMRLAPVARRLGEILGSPVFYVQDCVGPTVEKAAIELQPGEVLLLENLRFHPEEEANDTSFAKTLSSLADIYVNDAFGTAHRAHASTVGVANYLPAVAGYLIERELAMLGTTLESPARPFAAVLGGAKVSDKIAVLENLLKRVDVLVIGGGMATTFLKARGFEVGRSLLAEDKIAFASALMKYVEERRLSLYLPQDLVVASSFKGDAPYRVVDADEIPPDHYIMDIGPKTLSLYENVLKGCRTILWNGTMGVFEWKPFASGTRGIAQLLANLPNATTVVGGGSTAEAVDSLGLAQRMTHVSTGGGASLEFLEGKTLPGVAVLMDKT